MFELDVSTAVARVRERNPVLHAFITTRLEEALADAQVLANERPRSCLHGVPYSLKDEWETEGLIGALHDLSRSQARGSKRLRLANH